MSARRSVFPAIVTGFVVGLVVACAAPGTARAYRPFDQTDADVAETHDVELELGPVGLLHAPTGWSYIPGFILNYGVVHRVELVFDAHHAFVYGGPDVEARRRLLDTGLFAKAVVREGALQDRPGPAWRWRPARCSPPSRSPAARASRSPRSPPSAGRR